MVTHQLSRQNPSFFSTESEGNLPTPVLWSQFIVSEEQRGSAAANACLGYLFLRVWGKAAGERQGVNSKRILNSLQ